MFYKNLKGIYIFAEQKYKCQEKVWKKGVEFRRRLRLCRDKLRRGKRTDPAKGLFPLLRNLPLLGTERFYLLETYSFNGSSGNGTLHSLATPSANS